MIIALFVLGVVLFAAAGEYWYVEHKLLENVSAEYYVAQSIADVGEEIPVCLTVRNHGQRKIPYLRFHLSFPKSFDSRSNQDKMRKGEFGEKEVTWSTWLDGESEARFQLLIYGQERGRYVLKKPLMTDGDFLGISEENREVNAFTEIVVAPKESEDMEIQAAMGSFMGLLSVQRFIYEDPILTIGHREYTGTEAFKSIDWMQSAKGHGLMVRNYDHTTDVRVTVILDVGSSSERERVEECYRIARTVCRILEEKAYPYRILTNAEFDLLMNQMKEMYKEKERSLRSEYGLGEAHFRNVREILGRAMNSARTSLEDLLKSSTDSNVDGTEYIIITPDLENRDLLAGVNIRGRKPLILMPKEVQVR